MTISEELKQRNRGLCELCNTDPSIHPYTVSPKSDGSIQNQVGICNTCLAEMDNKNSVFHWRCLEGSIWSPEPAVKALSYRILQAYKGEDWVADLLASVDLDEDVIEWAMSAFEVIAVHRDAFGNVLVNGDNVVLTQALDVKGMNFTASKGTVVKRIKLVVDNTEHIEGKVNEQTIVILTRFVKKL